MFVLTVYNSYGEIESTLYFHYQENAEYRARKILKEYIQRTYDTESPMDYGWKTWNDLVETAIDEWGWDDVFCLEEAQFED